MAGRLVLGLSSFGANFSHMEVTYVRVQAEGWSDVGCREERGCRGHVTVTVVTALFSVTSSVMISLKISVIL